MSKLSLRRPSDLFAGLDQFFNKTFNDLGFGEEFDLNFRGYPRIDVYDDGSMLKIDASVPGLTKDNVRVDWKDNTLLICGDATSDRTRKMDNYVHKELHKSTFCRSLKVDESKFDIEKIDAKVINGLLEITIPKKGLVQAETKRIEVK